MKILVTGSTRGIGKAIAERLNAPMVGSKECDTTNLEKLSKYKDSDVLITCASYGVLTQPTDEVSYFNYRKFMEVDLDGVFLACKTVIPHMKKYKWGRIINITSLHTAMSWPQRSIYSMAKAGVAGFSRSLAVELGGFGITVNSVAPGPIETPRITKLDEENPGMIKKMASRSPNKRLGIPDEVAHAVEFLIENSHISGQEIRVDGGYSVNGGFI